jgi:hypothetical protein
MASKSERPKVFPYKVLRMRRATGEVVFVEMDQYVELTKEQIQIKLKAWGAVELMVLEAKCLQRWANDAEDVSPNELPEPYGAGSAPGTGDKPGRANGCG